MAWYLIWGWVAFLLPLLGVAAVTLHSTIGSVAWRLTQSLLTADSYASTIAEFVLADVVISDTLYATISSGLLDQPLAAVEAKKGTKFTTRSLEGEGIERGEGEHSGKRI